MKQFNRILTTAIFLFIVPLVITSAQKKKSEQRVKIIVAGDHGADIIPDTLIKGSSSGDTIVLKDGTSFYLTDSADNNHPQSHKYKRYVVTTTSSDTSGSNKERRREVTIISSDSDMRSAAGNCDKQYKPQCHEPGKGAGKEHRRAECSDITSEMTKYVISRDGLVITVEGSDYKKVKDLIQEIETTLDKKESGK